MPTDQITAASGGFRLVFTPSTDDVTAPDFDPNADELPSPAFFVTDDSTASSTSSPYGATASATDTASPDAGSMMLTGCSSYNDEEPAAKSAPAAAPQSFSPAP